MKTLVNLRSSSAIQDPFPLLAELRVHDPVHWNEDLRGWVFTLHEDITQAMRDPRFSSDRIRPFVAHQRSVDAAVAHELGRHISLWAVFNDPPIHTRLRKLLNKAFTPTAVKALQPMISAHVAELIEAMDGRQTCDFIADFAYPLPIRVISSILGIDLADAHDLKRWSDDLSAFVLVSRTDPDKYQRALSGLRGLNAYFSRLIEERRRQPQGALIDELISAHDGEDSLSTDELVATCVLLLFAGHETTTHFLANGLRALLLHPDQLALLRQRLDQPEAVANACKEMLRWEGPSISQVRIVREALEWGGKSLAAGDRVFMFLCAANRDPAVFPDPDRFDITRPEANRHVAFGFGIHVCLGMHVARMEAETAIPALLRRFPHLQLDDQPHVFSDSMVNRGMHALHLRLA